MLSLPKKSSRPSMSCKSLPYNGSASYYCNTPPPLFTPIQSSQFRRRSKPTLPLYQPGQPYLTVPNPTYLHPSYSSPSYGYGNVPKSPLLNQVVTSYTSGPSVLFMAERKREEPTKQYLKIVLVILAVILACSLICFFAKVGTVTEEGVRERKPSLQIVNIEIEGPSEAEIFEDLVAPAELAQENKTYSQRIPEVIVKETVERTQKPYIKVVYSYNEDLEATLESISR